MTTVRSIANVTLVVGLAVFIATWLAVESGAQAPEKTALAGAWTRNTAASDQPPDRGDRSREDGRQGGGRGGGFGRGGGMRRGGFGGGMGRGQMANPEEMKRIRDAMRDLMEAPDHLTIVQTDSLVVLTTGDGRTTRLSPDGTKVKDDNTQIERRTRWENGKLVSDIKGPGQNFPNKMSQTYVVDSETHQLRVTLSMEGRDKQMRTTTNVYDPDQR